MNSRNNFFPQSLVRRLLSHHTALVVVGLGLALLAGFGLHSLLTSTGHLPIPSHTHTDVRAEHNRDSDEKHTLHSEAVSSPKESAHHSTEKVGGEEHGGANGASHEGASREWDIESRSEPEWTKWTDETTIIAAPERDGVESGGTAAAQGAIWTTFAWALPATLASLTSELCTPLVSMPRWTTCWCTTVGELGAVDTDDVEETEESLVWWISNGEGVANIWTTPNIVAWASTDSRSTGTWVTPATATVTTGLSTCWC